MNVSSRTPEGDPFCCPVCGEWSALEPSVPGGDALCPSCGQLLWQLHHELHLDLDLAGLFFERSRPTDVIRLMRALHDLYHFEPTWEDMDDIQTIAELMQLIQHRRQPNPMKRPLPRLTPKMPTLSRPASMLMADIEPFVRHMILCDKIQSNPDVPHKIDLLGLVSSLRRAPGQSFPVRHEELCVYVALTEVRKRGKGCVSVVYADTAKDIFVTKQYDLQEGTEPLDVMGFVFRLKQCRFPRAGLYLIQFKYNGKVLAEQPLLVR